MRKELQVSAVRVFALFLLLAMLAVGATAQIESGIFTGTVTDPSGAAVPGANVTINNIDTNYTTTVTTNNSGSYTSQALPVGNYKITVEAAGFKTDFKSSTKLDVGTIQRADFKVQIGQRSETVEVTTEAAQVNTVDSKLTYNVTGDQVASLPLNGRNVYDLIQLAPGAVNVKGVLSENGAGTVVNGVREDFNGFMINGVSNKGLSGGAVNQPIQDSVAEFQLLTLNNSAQYGNSAGSNTNLVTKGGTNAFHGSAWEFIRNNALDANNFFNNKLGRDAAGKAVAPNPGLHFNQFGGTFGGPIKKDKLFFFGTYQGDRFNTSSSPTPITVESPDWRAAVIAGSPNSVAALLYKNFLPGNQGTPAGTLADYVSLGNGANGAISDYLCPDNFINPQQAVRMQGILGVTAGDQAALAASKCSVIPALRAGTFDRTKPFFYNTNGLFKQQTKDNLFNGNEASARIDYNLSENDRMFGQFNFFHDSDKYGPSGNTSYSGSRGFFAPQTNSFPNLQFTYSHTFNPNLVNEFRAGYTGNISNTGTLFPGVPQVALDDGSMGFGAYNGYPQTFHENIYTYSDMVSIQKGNHSLKVGADVRRNIENSLFNVARPSYYFFDPLYFAADAPYGQAAGVDPGIISSSPSHLQPNVRHWRNAEIGAYFQDDWKVSRRLTLNLGLRYDLFTRHNEKANLATTFIKGPGNSLIDNISTGAGQIRDASLRSCPQDFKGTVAGECGPGGFAAAKSLGKGNIANFGPRIGFALDVFGTGKTSLRGGFGKAYEGTLYNPLSNSRWNPPYYSFNQAFNALTSLNNGANIVYGPVGGGVPTFTGAAPAAQQSGTGAQANGNINGWDPTNPNLAFLSGIIFPEGLRDPYVYNYFLSLQHEIVPKTVLQFDYVGTTGRKLFRAQDVNRIPGGLLPQGTCTKDNFGRTICSQKNLTPIPGTVFNVNSSGRLNPNFGTLRVWQNVVDSNYNALQVALRRQMSRGFTLNLNYTWSHSIDDGSTWHSGSTSSNGKAAGEGYTTEVGQPKLDRGNSIFDVRQRFVANYVLDLPSFQGRNSFVHAVLGGWQLNGIWSYQSGAHWSPFTRKSSKLSGDCSQAGINAGLCINKGGDFNLDGERNERPNSTITNFAPTHNQWANGWGGGFQGFPGTVFTRPCLGCTGNLGRNTFVGPGFFGADMSLFKNIQATERFKVQFRTEAFNIFNHTNFQLPGSNLATHNRITDGSFGQAGGTFNPRQMQFGLKVSF